jgi:hypothetical protein
MSFKTVTGFGVIRNDKGKVVSRFEFEPESEHETSPGFSFEDVPDRAALDAVEIEKTPPTEEELAEREIQEKLRVLAVREIKKENPAFEDPRKKQAEPVK